MSLLIAFLASNEFCQFTLLPPVVQLLPADGFLMKLKAYSVMFLVNGKCIFVTAGCIRYTTFGSFIVFLSGFNKNGESRWLVFGDGNCELLFPMNRREQGWAGCCGSESWMYNM